MAFLSLLETAADADFDETNG
jgi:hypothetical protein